MIRENKKPFPVVREGLLGEPFVLRDSPSSAVTGTMNRVYATTIKRSLFQYASASIS
jgi:hypothetical protein